MPEAEEKLLDHWYTRWGQVMAEMLQAKIHRDLLAPPAEAVRVRCAASGERAVVLGAVGLVLYELFEPLPAVTVRAAQRGVDQKALELVLT